MQVNRSILHSRNNNPFSSSFWFISISSPAVNKINPTMKFLSLALLLVTFLSACRTTENKPASADLGSVEKNDPALDQIISSNAVVEKLGEGYTWSEGPVWVASQNML